MIGGVSVPVTAVTWASGTYPNGLAMNALEWTMYELPGVGDRYWHDRMGYTVRAVDETEERPRVGEKREPQGRQRPDIAAPGHDKAAGEDVGTLAAPQLRHLVESVPLVEIFDPPEQELGFLAGAYLALEFHDVGIGR